MKLPNFLIAGASKTGSTTLHFLLNQHPDITFSEGIKEPSFFISEIAKNYKNCKAFDKSGIIYTWDDYKALYNHVSDERAIGDASVGYLYRYNHSIPKIKKYLGDLKIILLLRNPVEKMISQYNHLISIDAEPLEFNDAIHNEKERIEEGYPPLYHYIQTSLYYNQVKVFIENFNNVKIIFSEELQSDKIKVANDCCHFLGVKNHNFEKSDNQNQSDKRILSRHNPFSKYSYLNAIKRFVKKRMDKKKYDSLKYGIIKHFASDHIYKPDKNEKIALSKYFYDDLKNLETLLRKDLSNWYKVQ